MKEIFIAFGTIVLTLGIAFGLEYLLVNLGLWALGLLGFKLALTTIQKIGLTILVMIVISILKNIFSKNEN
jgi:hypothetical protein